MHSKTAAALKIGVGTLATLLVIVTLLPLVPAHTWWIRALDFPRAQIAALLVATLVAVAALFPPWTGATLVLLGAVGLC